MSIPDTFAAFAAGGGVVPDPHDPRDHYYSPDPIEPPPRKDLRQSNQPGVTKIYDQFDTGSCVANAAAAALWFEEIAGRHTGNWGDNGPSRLFIYWLARALGRFDNDDNFTSAMASDNGSNTRNAMKGIAIRGACPEADCPFPDFDGPNGIYATLKKQGKYSDANIKAAVSPIINAKPSATAYTDGVPHKITNYYRIDLNRPDQTSAVVDTAQRESLGQDCLRKTKQCLSEGYPVLFSYRYYLPGNLLYERENSGNYNYFDAGLKKTVGMIKLKDIWNEGTTDTTASPPLNNRTFPRHTPVDPNQKFFDQNKNQVDLGGHAVLAIGYDEKYFFVQNSWGTDWSNSGVFLVPYTWISDYAATNDFWTIRVTPIAQAKATAAKPVLWQQVEQQVLA